MRGEDQRSEGFFSYVRLETRIPADHPLRAILEIVDVRLENCRQSSTGFMRARDDRRFHRSDCCVRFCCKPSTRCVRNGS